MRPWLSLLAASLLSACITGEDSRDEAAAPGWKRLIISGVGSIYAATGDFSARFYIATAGAVLVTDDGGTNWTPSLELAPFSPPLGFARHGDSLILKTVVHDYVTVNGGETWNMSEASDLPVENLRFQSTSKGDILEFRPPVAGGHHGTGGHTHHAPPAELYLIHAETLESVSIFAYRTYAYSVYLDKEDRVFLCTNDWEWNSEIRAFDTGNSQNDGVIYIGNLYP